MLRALLLLLAILLVLGVVASLLAPSDLRTPTTAPVTVIDLGPPPVSAPEIDVALPSARPIDVAQGDVVRLAIRAALPDTARLPALGLHVPVGPGVDGVLRFVADQPGRFAVRLDRTGRPAGVLVVAPARE